MVIPACFVVEKFWEGRGKQERPFPMSLGHPPMKNLIVAKLQCADFGSDLLVLVARVTP